MESIPYRNTTLSIKTIPKGTLLFRLVKNPEDDLRGVQLENGTRCLTPNYNVFFYPNPFMASLALSKWVSDYTDIHIYILEKDVKVLYLLSPSKYTRHQTTKKRSFIKKCSTVKKGCLPRKQPEYDPCFSDTLIKKYPEVVGMLAISAADVYRAKRKLKNKPSLRRYFHDAVEESGIRGVPELILHPLVKRPQKDMIGENMLETNYSLLKKLPLEESTLKKFMDKHATYNQDTYFFTYKQ
jgi:hypothetical protein